MFINGRSWCDSDGTQHGRGKFLMLFEDPNSNELRMPLRACVRTVSLVQLGHFMMGQVRLAGKKIILSGAYGSDGLPITLLHKDVPEEAANHIWESLSDVPSDLQTSFWEGGGHNSTGSEADAMKKWALDNLKQLSKPIKIFKQKGE